MLNLLAGSTWPYPRSTVDPLAARYNAVAHHWHLLIRRLGYLHAYRDLLRSLAAKQLLPAGGCVVDCGIGSGGFSLALLQTTRATWRVEGVDISAAMLRVAKTNLTPFTQVTTDASRIDAMTFHCTDARRLPQADQVADLVISAHMLEHLADPVAALREMHRVLKPGAPVLTIITRKGLLGSYLHRKWGVACVQEEEACHWLHQAGFAQVRCVALHNPLLPCTWSSLACMGWRA